jgi:hypothetical protein
MATAISTKTTTKIHVSAVDNELYLIAVSCDARYSSEIVHLKSGFDDRVDYTVRPQVMLEPGEYTLVMVGINWGSKQAFEVTLTTGGVTTTYSAPPSTAVGANWTEAVRITV